MKAISNWLFGNAEETGKIIIITGNDEKNNTQDSSNILITNTQDASILDLIFMTL